MSNPLGTTTNAFASYPSGSIPASIWNVISVAANGTTSLTAAQSGSILTLGSAASGAGIIQLPVASSSPGVHFRVVLNANQATNTWTIRQTTGTASTMYLVCTDLSTGQNWPGAGTTNIVVNVGALKGDQLEIYSDGNVWFAKGQGLLTSTNTATGSFIST